MRTLPAPVVMLGAIATAVNPVFVRASDLAPVASAFHRMAWALPLVWLWAGLERLRGAEPLAPARTPALSGFLTVAGGDPAGA